MVERAAGQLAASFQIERIAAELRARLAEKRASLDASIDELHNDLAARVERWRHQFDDKVEIVRHELDELIRGVQLSAMPTMTELSSRAAAMFVRSSSMNEIVERARQMLIENVYAELAGRRAMVESARA